MSKRGEKGGAHGERRELFKKKWWGEDGSDLKSRGGRREEETV